MAITLTHLQAGLSDESVTTVSVPSFTLPANRLGIGFIVQAGGGPPSNIPSIPNWTVHTTYEHADVRRITMLTRVVGSNTTEGLTISFGGQTQSFVTFSFLHADENCVITGTAGANGIVQALGSGDVHGPSVNTTPTLDALAAFANVNNASLSAINIGWQADAASPGTGFTQLSAAGVGSFSTMGTVTQWKATNDTVHELTNCTNSADMFIGMAVELNHVTGGGPTTYTFSVSGGITYSGSANLQQTRVLSAGGSIAFSGSAVYQRTRRLLAAGEASFSGAANMQHLRSLSAGGTLQFSGSGSMVFTPAGGSAAPSYRSLVGAGL